MFFDKIILIDLGLDALRWGGGGHRSLMDIGIAIDENPSDEGNRPLRSSLGV